MKSLLRKLIVAFAEHRYRRDIAQFVRYYDRLPLRVQSWLAPRLSNDLLPEDNVAEIALQLTLVSGQRLRVRSAPGGPFFTRSLSLLYPIHDRLTKQALANLASAAPSAQIFLDVGFNLGTLAIEVLACAREHELIGFEANDELLPTTTRLFEALNLPVPQIISAAVSDSDGSPLSFYLSRSSYQSSLNQKHAAREGETREIRTTTISLDCFSTRLSKPVAAIKIDVEGGEVAVLRGATKLLAAHQPALLIEIFADIRTRCWNILTPLGYQIYTADHKYVQLDQAQFEQALGSNYLAVMPGSWQHDALITAAR